MKHREWDTWKELFASVILRYVDSFANRVKKQAMRQLYEIFMRIGSKQRIRHMPVPKQQLPVAELVY